MPDRETVLATLRAHEAELRAKGVEALYLFGSVARGDARPDSDIDLFFDARENLGWDIIDIYDALESFFPSKVDITTRGGLHPRLKDRILRDAQEVFK